MTHSRHPLTGFEEFAAKTMENCLKLLYFFRKLEGTGSFPEGLPEILFLGFHASAVSGSSWKVFGSFTGSKWKENEKSLECKWETMKIYMRSNVQWHQQFCGASISWK